MKKAVVCLMLVVSLAVLLCGCNKSKGGADTTMTTVDRSQITTTLPTTATTLPTEPPVQVDAPIAYQSELHPALQMTLPASWNGKYAVREGENSIDFFELQNHLENGSGKLFTLRFMNADEYSEGMFPSYDVVYQTADRYVLALYPTDLQTTEAYAEQYNAMSAELPNITETVRYDG